MSLVARNEQQRSAQLAYGRLLPHDAEVDLDEAANELLNNREVRRQIAADDLAFSLDSDWFTDVTDQMIQLDVKHPSDLMGSQLLTDLYRLARTVRAAAMDVAREKVGDAANERLRAAWARIGWGEQA